MKDSFSHPSNSTLMQTPLCPIPSTCMACTQMSTHAKDLTSVCCERVGLTADGMKTRKHCTQDRKKRKNKDWRVPHYSCLLSSPGESSPNFPHIALGEKSYLIQSHVKEEPVHITRKLGLLVEERARVSMMAPVS